MYLLVQAAYLILFFQIFLCAEEVDKSQYLITIGRPSNKSYSATTQICCNGVIYNKQDLSTACCGNQTYSKKTETCCNSIITKKEPNVKCCTNQLYNTKTHKCDFIVSQATTDWYIRKYYTFADNNRLIVTPIAGEYEIACGEKMINLQTQICCQQKPVATASPDFANCCGDKSFNPRYNFCCQDDNTSTLLPPELNGEDSCCKGKPYNSFREYCNWDNGTVTELQDSYKMVCGDEIIDTREKICSREKVGETFKNLAYKKQKSDDYYYCGNTSFSLSENICCNGTLIPRNGALKCCFGSGVYDPSIDTCCHPRNYVTDEYISKLYKNKIGSCCYVNLYDETKESCCGVSVVPKLPADQSGCCEYQVNGTDATLDELINSYKRPFEAVFL